MAESGEAGVLQLVLELLGLHACVVEGVAALVKHHVHDDGAGPDVD